MLARRSDSVCTMWSMSWIVLDKTAFHCCISLSCSCCCWSSSAAHSALVSGVSSFLQFTNTSNNNNLYYRQYNKNYTGTGAYSFLTQLGRKISEISDDDCEGSFLFQRISVLISATILLCCTLVLLGRTARINGHQSYNCVAFSLIFFFPCKILPQQCLRCRNHDIAFTRVQPVHLTSSQQPRDQAD